MHDYRREILLKMVDEVLNNPIGSNSTRINVENAVLSIEIMDKIYSRRTSDAPFDERKQFNDKLKTILDILLDSSK